MVSLKLSQPGLFGPPQLEDPTAPGIGLWPVQVTVGFVPDTVPEAGVAPLATAETRRRVDTRAARRTREYPLVLLLIGRRREGIFFSLGAMRLTAACDRPRLLRDRSNRPEFQSALHLEISSSGTTAATVHNVCLIRLAKGPANSPSSATLISLS